jgi:hypothetical protein
MLPRRNQQRQGRRRISRDAFGQRHMWEMHTIGAHDAPSPKRETAENQLGPAAIEGRSAEYARHPFSWASPLPGQDTRSLILHQACRNRTQPLSPDVELDHTLELVPTGNGVLIEIVCPCGLAMLPSRAMSAVLISLLAGLASTLRTRTSLQVEVLALRHQLAVLQRTKRRRVPLRAMDRLLWVALRRLWPEWRKALVLVKPETAIRTDTA